MKFTLYLLLSSCLWYFKCSSTQHIASTSCLGVLIFLCFIFAADCHLNSCRFDPDWQPFLWRLTNPNLSYTSFFLVYLGMSVPSFLKAGFIDGTLDCIFVFPNFDLDSSAAQRPLLLRRVNLSFVYCLQMTSISSRHSSYLAFVFP